MTDSWSTPKEYYDPLNKEFHFNDDPCPFNDNPLIDGLSREWGTSVFMNPPYSNPGPWCEKAYKESLKGKIIVGLLRGDTSTLWFHEWVLPYADLRFIKGRTKWPGSKVTCPFPCIIAVWGKKGMQTGTTLL